MTKKIFFITATNTDIGKTIITAGLASIYASNNMTPAIMKPIQTGTSDYPTDYSTIDRLIPNLATLPESISQPYKFKLPASPHLAAAQENIKIDINKILNAYDNAQQYNYDALLVEGAGGVMVPITEDYLMIDLMKELNIPVIIVTTPILGTINSTLLSVEMLKNHNIEIAGIIFNQMPNGKNLIAEDNVRIIEKTTSIPILAQIKQFPQPITEKTLIEEFSRQKKLKQLLIS